jgi:hypothetical protein
MHEQTSNSKQLLLLTKSLVAGITSANTHAESDFGKPVGKEIC